MRTVPIDDIRKWSDTQMECESDLLDSVANSTREVINLLLPQLRSNALETEERKSKCSLVVEFDMKGKPYAKVYGAPIPKVITIE